MKHLLVLLACVFAASAGWLLLVYTDQHSQIERMNSDLIQKSDSLVSEMDHLLDMMRPADRPLN